MTPLRAHCQYICIVYAKYQKASVKALVQDDFPSMHYLSKSKTRKQEKMAKFTELLFCQKLIFWQKTSSCKCSMCLYYVGKVSDSFSKALVQIDFPVHALPSTNKTLIKKQSVKKMSTFKTLSFCQKIFLWHQTSSCKCSMCQNCVCKVSDGFSKNSGTSWFPRAYIIWALTKPLLKSSVKNG